MQTSERSFLLQYTYISILVNIEPIAVCCTIDSIIWFLRQKSLVITFSTWDKKHQWRRLIPSFDVLFLVYIRTLSVASVILDIKEWLNDLWVMMWKWSLSNLRNYRGLGLEAMRQLTKTLRQDGWSPVRDLNWALTQCSARDKAWFCRHVIMRIVLRDILSPSARCHKDMSVPTILRGA